MIELKNILRKNTTRNFGGDIHNALINPGKHITIYGRYENNIHPHDYRHTFIIGSTAVYGSYNLIYTGTIINIGPKTVSIEDHGKVTRLKIWEFCDKNMGFNLAKIEAHNAAELQCI